jgi:adenine-specific DNA methylase
MGSKKGLAPFLVESFFAVADSNTQVVDLMCGSGAAAGAFARFWPTYASDAQVFCRLLAQVQGGGYSHSRAVAVLEQIHQAAGEHAAALRVMAQDFVDREDRILHDEFSEDTVHAYRTFLMQTPHFPDAERVGNWDPRRLVSQRQLDHKKFPYCLSTSYFANVYFGFRQSIEIDSIRFAIDQLADSKDRAWALGALVTTCSAVALTYGGHFAQPVIRSPESITASNLARILEKRAMSVMHEFSIRFLNLAEESERTGHPVVALDGPWGKALQTLDCRLNNRTIVYVDAPYKREEYSRYYHVLETLCTYGYPDSTGLARIPSKKSGARFQSEFFTRSANRVIAAFAELICGIIDRRCICAWSYSDNGAIDPIDVIEAVRAKHSVRLHSFATPFAHKAQGGSTQKSITEYLVLFLPS